MKNILGILAIIATVNIICIAMFNNLSELKIVGVLAIIVDVIIISIYIFNNSLELKNSN